MSHVAEFLHSQPLTQVCFCVHTVSSVHHPSRHTCVTEPNFIRTGRKEESLMLALIIQLGGQCSMFDFPEDYLPFFPLEISVGQHQ